jgi:hypothetical protein
VQPGTVLWPLGAGITLPYTFAEAGTKYVRLRVSDALGRTSTVEHSVEVLPATSTTTTSTTTSTTTTTATTTVSSSTASTATSTTTTTTTTTTSTRPSQTNCVILPSVCGYPDATNSGVPAGTTLSAPQGSLTITTPNTVLRNADVHGTITVDANHVTIEDSRIVAGNGELNGVSGIVIPGGITGTTVRYTTLEGSNCTNGSMFAGVMNQSDDTLVMDHDYGSCLDDILHGSGTLANSYSIDNANIPEDHYEPVAYDGGQGGLWIRHDTLLNPHGQTAAVFTQCTWGGNVTPLVIEANLMAGGDFVIYGPLSDPCPDNGAEESVIANRISRIYFPNGGYYGVAAYFAANTAWSGNVWDETLQTIAGP